MDALERLGKETMPFGKYGPRKDAAGNIIEPGKSFDRIPLTYLDWLVGQELWEPLKSSLEAYMGHPTIQRELEKEQSKPRRSSIKLGLSDWGRRRHF